MIDASAVARVLGIETAFKDLRAGGVLFLPQRIAVLAQGSSDAVYSLEKWPGSSSGSTGARFGFGSPAHLIARELLPANGDGVGTIPVTFYPLADAPGSTPAVGDITPSGTAQRAAAYRVRVSGIASLEFVVPAGPVNASNVCGALGAAVNAVLEMPVTVSYEYGAPAASALAGTGNGTLTGLAVTGSPRPGTYVLRCTRVLANGGVWSLTDPNGTVLSDALTMKAEAGAASAFEVGGIAFTLTDGATDFGLGAAFAISIPASRVLFTSKWKGESANALRIEVTGEATGVTFAVSQPSGGLVNPTVNSALGQMGNVWESMALNAQNIEDETALDAFQNFGEGRWNKLVRKPLVVFTGNTDADVAEATRVSSKRRTDRINAQLVAPGSPNLPCVVAARQLARIAVLANNNPPTDYGAEQATGLTAGPDGVQWDYLQRDRAVKAGSSTIEVVDGVVSLSDIVTFYRPSSEDPPGYRYVVDIVKVQQCIFNTDLIFASREWAGAPLIADGEPTVNPRARRASSAIAQVARMLDSLGLNAIITNVKVAKKKIRAGIDAQNPKRLNLRYTVQLSGNSNIISVDLEFGFFYGSGGV